MQSAPLAPTARKLSRLPSGSATRGVQQVVPKLVPTPPLTRSLSSSPSSSTLPEDDQLSDLRADELKIVYAAGLNSLDLDLDEVHETVAPPKLRSVRKRSLLTPSESSFVPNPHAVPFIPTIVRKRHAADPYTCILDVAPVWLPHRDWIRPMQSGAASSQSGVRRSYARKVVEAGPWDTAMMSELAGKIVDFAAEGSERDAKVDTMDCVAQFAQHLHTLFGRMLNEDAAKTFRQLLKQCLLSEYRAWWLSTLSSAVALIPSQSSSPPHAHPLRLLTCALGVADFVGATFAVGLTSGSYVMLCINMLVERLAVVEELQAIRCILKHTGDALYECAHMEELLVSIKARVDDLKDKSSAVGETGVRLQARVIYEDIERIVRTWAESRMTPTLTEISDTATEYSDYNPEFTVHRTAMAPEGASPPLFVPQSQPRPPTRAEPEPESESESEPQEQHWTRTLSGVPPVQRDTSNADAFARVSSTRTVRPDDYAPPSRIPVGRNSSTSNSGAVTRSRSRGGRR